MSNINVISKHFQKSGGRYIILDIKEEDSIQDALLFRDDGVAVIANCFHFNKSFDKIDWSHGDYFMNGLENAAKKFYNLK